MSHETNEKNDQYETKATKEEKTHRTLEWYHREIDAANNHCQHHLPWHPFDHYFLQKSMKRCLGIRDEMVPEISVKDTRTVRLDDLEVDFLRAESWPGVTTTAVCFRRSDLHASAQTPAPVVLLCCGHGKGCKLNPTYQRMAIYLAQAGAVVLTADNIGQGEREPMGHRRALAPLAAGLSLQGLITMESMAWLDWLKEQEWADVNRIAAIGNSGGGKLTQTLACLGEGLAAIASSGNGENMAVKAHKERELCACALFPGVLGEYDDWQLYGCFAPRPLFLFQGTLDHFFAQDVFRRTARQVRRCYQVLGAEEMLDLKMVPGEHSWDEERLILVRDFLAHRIGIEPSKPGDAPGSLPILPEGETVLSEWPEDALDTTGLTRHLTGYEYGDERPLWEVVPPDLTAQLPPELLPEPSDPSWSVSPDEIAQVSAPLDGMPVDTRWILAQMHTYLYGVPKKAEREA